MSNNKLIIAKNQFPRLVMDSLTVMSIIRDKLKDLKVRDTMSDLKDTMTDKLNFVVRKAEKLSRAVYVVSDFMSDREPIKWRLRELAVEISESLGKDIAFTIEILTKKIPQIISVIDLALGMGNVSQMNFTLLRKEYSDLFAMLKNENQAFFNTQVEVRAGIAGPGGNMSLAGTSSLLERPAAQTTEHKRQLVSHGFIKDTSRTIASTVNKGQRQEEITKFLKGKDWVSIKDISHLFPTVSGKTVQRELTDLVGRGVLKKKGERRWSRYSLN